MGSSKNVLLTVVICVAILLAWQFLQQRIQPQRPPVTKQAQDQPRKGTGKAPKKAPPVASKEDGKTSPDSKTQAEATGPRSSSVEGKKVTIKLGKVAEGSFTSNGAALRHWKLGHPRYKLMRDGKLEKVDLVFTRKGEGPWPLATVLFTDEGESAGVNLPANAEYTLIKQVGRQVHYKYQDKAVRVIKEYAIDKSGTLAKFNLRVKNLTDAELSQNLKLSLYNYHDPTLAKPAMTNPYPRIPTVTCHDGVEIQRRSRDSIKGTGSDCSAAGCGMGDGEFISASGNVWWIGSGDRYFITSVVPQDDKVGKKCELTMLEGKENVIQASLYYPKFRLAAGKEKTWNFNIYLGAKELKALDEIKGPTKDGDIGMSAAIDFGWFMPLCRPMLWLLKMFHSVFGNWGIAIILLTLVVKALTLYWTQKSMRSMKKMQHLKPQIDVLREKFGDDKNRLNQEMMSLETTFRKREISIVRK